MPLLVIEKLSKDLGAFSLSKVSFAISPGEIVGIVGPNGSGKTTLLNLIGGSLLPDSGSVYLDGRNILKLPQHRLVTAGLGRVFQNPRVVSTLTVEQNVALGLYWRDKVGLKRDYEIDEILHAYGLVKLRRERPSSLTFFELRRLELARLQATRSRVWLLDEPTSGFSESETIQFLDLISRQKDDAHALLMVEHDVNLVESLCETVVALEAGAIVFQGPTQDWLKGLHTKRERD